MWMFGDATLNEPAEKAQFDRWVNTLQLQQKLIMYSNMKHMKQHFSCEMYTTNFMSMLKSLSQSKPRSEQL